MISAYSMEDKAHSSIRKMVITWVNLSKWATILIWSTQRSSLKIFGANWISLWRSRRVWKIKNRVQGWPDEALNGAFMGRLTTKIVRVVKMLTSMKLISIWANMQAKLCGSYAGFMQILDNFSSDLFYRSCGAKQLKMERIDQKHWESRRLEK